jgi:hypothetical protein
MFQGEVEALYEGNPTGMHPVDIVLAVEKF